MAAAVDVARKRVEPWLQHTRDFIGTLSALGHIIPALYQSELAI
jgi:hypothetical protein